MTILKGENVDIVPPVEEDFEVWASWINNPENTKYLEIGKIGVTGEFQKKYYYESISEGRFIGIIKTKNLKPCGIISLSHINYEKKSADLAYICPLDYANPELAALEAISLCVTHAFDRLGLKRIRAGHAYPDLARWIQKTEVLGFFCEGFEFSAFVHGHYVTDIAITSLTYQRFQKLRQLRFGELWCGLTKMKQLIGDKLAGKPFAEELRRFLLRVHKP